MPGAPRGLVFGFLDLADAGAQRLTLVTCRHLDRERFRPVVLCARGEGSLVARARAEGWDVRTLGRLRRRFDLPAVAVLARELRELGCDILHVPLYSRASPYLRLAGRLAGVRLTVAHDWSQPAPPPLLRRLADALLDGGTRFVAASEAQRGELLGRGVPGGAIRVIHAGIEWADFGRESRSAARRELGWPEAARIVLVPARLQAVKGHADLLAALPRVRAAIPGLQVLCAGEGPLRATLAARADALDLGGTVQWLGWREEMPRLLAAADLVVLPSHVEGLPAALLEAFAARRAVVATAVGGVPEALTDGVEGRLVPARQPEALGAAILALLSDPARCEAMGAQGRRTVERRFDARTSTRKLEEAYEAWLAEAARRAARA